jgi:hypothetical protein
LPYPPLGVRAVHAQGSAKAELQQKPEGVMQNKKRRRYWLFIAEMSLFKILYIYVFEFTSIVF